MSSATPMTPAEYWDKYRPYRGEGEEPRPAAERFEWTGVPGQGPGAEVLGKPANALDLGPAEGENAAYLARRGVRVTGVDFSATQVARAQRFWSDLPGLEFVHAEACAFLAADSRRWDAIYSTWGAVWFTDPDTLFPLITQRLCPGGVFAFSHREPIVGQYGAQAMGGRWLEGRSSELIVHRWQFTAPQWSDLLKRHGFLNIQTEIIPGHEPGELGTLLVRGTRPSADGHL
ncbi:class I SAM-dependent methyltransferase [Streptomyces bauhiniae]|uniref:class I SAM-dependent methyltransferase n=1 Tax=Streptomyces bauhiniae TaxID=2340725 RepID=UPI0036C23F25